MAKKGLCEVREAHMNELNQPLLAALQEAASEGKSATEILELIRSSLEVGNARFLTIVYFHQAFGGTLGEAQQIGAWHKFPGGTWSDEKINEALASVLKIWKQENQYG